MRYLAQIPTSSLSRPNPFPILKLALYCLQIPFANLSKTAAPFSYGMVVFLIYGLKDLKQDFYLTPYACAEFEFLYLDEGDLEQARC